MGVHVPEKIIKHLSSLRGTVDLSTLSSKQLDNIHTYVTKGLYKDGDTITSTISRDILTSNNLNYIGGLSGLRWKGMPEDHPFWDSAEKALALCKLSVEYADDHRNYHYSRKVIDELLDIITKRPHHLDRCYLWAKDAVKTCSPTAVKLFEKHLYVKQELPEDVKQLIDGIKSGEATSYTLHF